MIGGAIPPGQEWLNGLPKLTDPTTIDAAFGIVGKQIDNLLYPVVYIAGSGLPKVLSLVGTEAQKYWCWDAVNSQFIVVEDPMVGATARVIAATGLEFSTGGLKTAEVIEQSDITFKIV